MKKNKLKNKNGFSFMEVIVAVFIFALIMVTVAGIFGRTVKSYRYAKDIQRNLEAAQEAMNVMAKTLRTSSVIGNYDSDQALVVFDYSQNKCIHYQAVFGQGKLNYRTAPLATDKQLCTDAYNTNVPPWDAMQSMITGSVSALSFDAILSNSGVVGKVTISMEICPNAADGCDGKDKARVQSTVSLRDYTESGL